MNEEDIVQDKVGRPFGTRTELDYLRQWIRKGPYSHRTEKFKAIAKLFDLNQENRLKKRKEITVEAFCNWTKIPELMVLGAETDPDFVRITQALSKGKMSKWFGSMLPAYMEAAERLSSNPEAKADIDKQFMIIMQTMAEMTNFQKSDLAPLSAMEDKDPTEIIQEAIILGRKLNESISDQKIIELLSEGVDRAESLRHGANDGSPISVIGRAEENPPNESDRLMDTVPEATNRAELAQRDYILHGSERNGEIGLSDSVHSLISLGEASSYKAKEASGSLAGIGHVLEDRSSIDAKNKEDDE